MKQYIYVITKVALLLILFNNNVLSQETIIRVCSGENASITASLVTPGSITTPVYKWYTEETGGTPIYTGDTYTTATAITSDTVFYVSVEGDDYCVGARLKINVEAIPCDLIACIGEKATMTASLAIPSSITNPVYKWYSTQTGGTPIHTGDTYTTATAINADTVFYVSVEGDGYCVGARLAVNVRAIPCTDNVTVCIGEKVTITAALETSGSITNPVFNWYDAPTGGTLLYTGEIFTSPTAIRGNTAFYVSVEGDGYCAGSRLKVDVTAVLCSFPAEKNAILLPNTIAENGTYPNPVSVLGNEVVKYEIKTTNPTLDNVDIVIVDTLPAYLEYISGTASSTPSVSVIEGSTPTPPYPERKVLRWRFQNIAPDASVTASFNAKPESGAVASQPLFINRAMVTMVKAPGDSTHIQTNGTFHQGAGISIMTFSAGIGGEIFNANEQVLDYMSTPTAGIIIAPEEGYRFAGWSHRGYISLRGAEIKAQRGIMHYDTLTVYGNVELHAEFVPVEILMMEEIEEVQADISEEDKVWTVNDEMFITTTKAGSIVRIYTTEGILREQHTIIAAGTTSRKLSRGIYIVTINNATGHKVRIE